MSLSFAIPSLCNFRQFNSPIFSSDKKKKRQFYSPLGGVVRVEGDNICSAVAGYLSFDVTVFCCPQALPGE